MYLPCAGRCCNGVFCVVNVLSSCCNYCLEKNLKCNLVVTQDNCKQSHKIS